MMEFNIMPVKLVQDNSGCKHSLIWPTRSEEDKLYGKCFLCHDQVALELDRVGRRTGRSWIVEALLYDDTRHRPALGPYADH